jgi:light-regulated signal transduction histidine kinase (bacteriophytochrome)/CheY-like chemotaxis protein
MAMRESAPPPSAKVDLLNCDREPIHLLGAVQRFGFLLSVARDWSVVRASENVQDFLGISADKIVGRPLDAFIDDEQVHDIRSRLQISVGTGIVERLFGKRLRGDGPPFDIAVHQSGREFVLEFEPSCGEAGASLASLRAMIARVERAAPQTMFWEVSRQIRALTGYDRVMVYRFDEDGAGEVVAEAAGGGFTSFLGLHYPASDIPSQARALYERNYLRIIADVDADPVPIFPSVSPEGEALDLSMSILRSVSPIHLEYLKNMGVKSSMSLSILQGARLWGLIACHHYSVARHLGLEIRSTAELFGQMFSYLLETRHRADEAAHEANAKALHNRIASAFAELNSSLGDVPGFLSGVANYIASDGIGAYHSGMVTLIGLTPSREEFLQLVKFLNKTASGRVFSTHRLGEVFPPASDYVMRAAGILSIPISRVPRDYVVFFRHEIVKSVTWAGEPVKTETLGRQGVRLTPRKSFEAWREIVKGQSERWTKLELRAAEALRVTLVELVVRMSEAAQASRSGIEQRQEILIAELNHRVRNILGLVRGLVTQSAATAGDLRAFVDRLEDRIRSLAKAHDLLTSTNWLPASLHALLRTEVDAYPETQGRVILRGPDVVLQPKAFSAMALVVHELVTNALKYGALTIPRGQVLVETAVTETSNVIVVWRESGGPMVTPPTRRGFGTTILEQAIPFELNGESKPSFMSTGFVLEILLPAAFAHGASAGHHADDALAGHSQNGADEEGLETLLHTSLVVEDNLFIAIDAEDLLRKLGARKIDIARSVKDALALIDKCRYSFALLDVNLAPNTSLPVARTLQAENIPFAFGTGYGETLTMPGILTDVPVIVKPYHRAGLAKALKSLLPASQSVSSIAPVLKV